MSGFKTGPWGIVIEWDEDGIECRTWARHALHAKRLDFSSQELAQQFVRALLVLPSDVDAIATPHRFGDTGPLIPPRPVAVPASERTGLICTVCGKDLNAGCECGSDS